MIRFIQHIVVLSKFHDTLLTIILHFGGDIAERHRRSENSLSRRHRRLFSYFAFDNLLKLFLAVQSDFMKLL